MKLLLALTLSLSITALAEDHYRNGYTKKDGTYVPGGYQTNPNGTKYDNYDSKGNYNPYTGKEGTKDPGKPYTPRK